MLLIMRVLHVFASNPLYIKYTICYYCTKTRPEVKVYLMRYLCFFPEPMLGKYSYAFVGCFAFFIFNNAYPSRINY